MSQEMLTSTMESIRHTYWKLASEVKRTTGIKKIKLQNKVNGWFALLQTCEEIYAEGGPDAEERIKGLKMHVIITVGM